MLREMFGFYNKRGPEPEAPVGAHTSLDPTLRNALIAAAAESFLRVMKHGSKA